MTPVAAVRALCSAIGEWAVGKGAPLSVPKPDWRAIWRVARRSGVSTLLTEILDVATTPPWLLEDMTHAHRAALRAGEQLRDVALDVAINLERAGVSVAFRKGVHVAGELYPNLGCRPFGDIDLYVRRSEEQALDNALRELGFAQVPMERTGRLFLRLATGTLPSYEACSRTDGSVILIDPAMSLTLPVMGTSRGEAEVPTLLSRRVWSDDGLPVLDGLDLMVDLMTNLYITSTTLRYVKAMRFQRLNGYVDLLLAAKRVGCGDWPSLWRRCMELGVEDAAVFTSVNLRQLFPIQEVVEWFSPPRTFGKGIAVADQLGQWELPEPYQWQMPLHDRLVVAELPLTIPMPLTDPVRW